MKSVGLFIPVILLIATSVGGQTLPESPTAQQFPAKPNAVTICAGDVPPENTVITATGTSVTCTGSCRARLIEPVEGPVMVICAGQPIPQYYDTQSITTSPACDCIGDQDNAYVIRRLNGAPRPTSEALPGFPGPTPAPARNRVSEDAPGIVIHIGRDEAGPHHGEKGRQPQPDDFPPRAPRAVWFPGRGVVSGVHAGYE